MKTLLTVILLTIGIRHSEATIRYVSHLGTNTPPYTTWETAADSIMFAVNISTFGDTIYVANGVYEEVVTLIPGLSLIGAGKYNVTKKLMQIKRNSELYCCGNSYKKGRAKLKCWLSL